jgi:hypothetical protein
MTEDQAKKFGAQLGHPATAPAEVPEPEQQAAIDDMEHRIAELNQALDDRKPAPDPAKLANHMQTIWARMLGTDLDQRWYACAETAIDYTRGLWPAHEHAAGGESAGDQLPVAASPTGATPGGVPSVAEAIAAAERDNDVVEITTAEKERFNVPTVRLAYVIAAGQLPHMMNALSWEGIGPLQIPILRSARAALDAGYRQIPTREGLAALLRAHDIDYIGFDEERTAVPGEPIPVRCACGVVVDPTFHLDHVAEKIRAALHAAGATR